MTAAEVQGPTITLPQLTLNFARQEIGQQEAPRGSNAGPRVEEYQAICHAKPGDPWCSCFACWCVHHAAKALGVTPALRFSASAMQMLSLNSALGIASPEPGCLVVWDHGGGKGHVGVVDHFDGIVFSAVEGNTDPAGGREGYEVAVKTHRWVQPIRRLDDPRIAGFVRVA